MLCGGRNLLGCGCRLFRVNGLFGGWIWLWFNAGRDLFHYRRRLLGVNGLLFNSSRLLCKGRNAGQCQKGTRQEIG